MARNYYDDGLVNMAVVFLRSQYVTGKNNGAFGEYDGLPVDKLITACHFSSVYRLPLVFFDNGTVTVGKLTGRTVVVDDRFVPVDCYNLILPGEDLATAVKRISGGGLI